MFGTTKYSFMKSFKHRLSKEAPRLLRRVLLFSAAISMTLLGLAIYLFDTAGQVAHVNSLIIQECFKVFGISAAFITLSGVVILIAALILLVHSGLLLSVLILNSPSVMMKDTIITLFSEDVSAEYSALTNFGETKAWLEIPPTQTAAKGPYYEPKIEPAATAKRRVGPLTGPEAAARPAAPEPVPASAVPVVADTAGHLPEKKTRGHRKKKRKKKRSVKPAYYIPKEGNGEL